MREVAAPTVIAAFDFDGTLTHGDSLLPFLRLGLGTVGLAGALLRSLPWLAGYALKLVPNNAAKARLLEAALAGRALEQVDGWAARWVAAELDDALRADALAQLAAHRAAGHCCVLVSASPDIYLKRVADRLGFDALLCTGMAVEEGRLTGRMATPNCHGEQKVLRLRQWARERFGLESFAGVTLHAYGDTAGDLPMLRLAQHAWYRGKPWPAPR